MFGRKKDRDAVQVIIDDRLAKLPRRVRVTGGDIEGSDITTKALAALETKRTEAQRVAKEQLQLRIDGANNCLKTLLGPDYIPLEWKNGRDCEDLVSNYEVSEGIPIRYDSYEDNLYVLNPFGKNRRLRSLADLGYVIEGVRDGTAW